MPDALPFHDALYLNRAAATVAFSGSGGKTTCCADLTDESLAKASRVILTTTTKMRVPPQHLDASSLEDIVSTLKRSSELLVLGKASQDGKKLCGPAPALLDRLVDRAATDEVADLIVIEADGSRGASVKGYREGEPVFPCQVDRACVVVGIDAIGADRMSPRVHRAEILWPLLGLEDAARLHENDVARALLSQPAYLAHAARFATSILINKVDDADAVERAEGLLAALEPSLVPRRIVRVIARGAAVPGGVAAIWQRPLRRRIGAVMMAAGTSTRFGGLKQTACVDGVPMAVRSARTLLATSIEVLIVVLGHAASAVRDCLSSYIDDRRMIFVENERHKQGLSTSIACGVSAAADIDGVLLALADMPHIDARTVTRLMAIFSQTPFDLVAPSYNGRRGHPVILDARYVDRLQTLQGDVGAAPLLRRHAADLYAVPVDDEGVVRDIDHAASAASKVSSVGDA